MTDAERKAWALTEAIEAFIAAKINYARVANHAFVSSSSERIDVDETREHLRDLLAHSDILTRGE